MTTSSNSSAVTVASSPVAATLGTSAPSASPASVEPPTVDPTVAYERLLPRLIALGTENLAPMNRDMTTATNIALKAVPKLLPYREAFARVFTAFDFEKLDLLWDAAKATQCATAYLTATTVTEDALTPAYAASQDDHQWLLNVLTTLVGLGRVPAKALDEVKKGTGYTATVSEIFLMDAYLDTNWEKAKERAGMTTDDRAAIRARAGHLQNLINERQKAEARQGDATLRRMQAFTLLSTSYDYVRAALAFVLVAQGNTGSASVSVDDIAPSLYTLSKPRKNRASDDSEAPEGKGGSSPSEPPVAGGSAAPVISASVKNELASSTAATDELPALGPAFGS